MPFMPDRHPTHSNPRAARTRALRGHVTFTMPPPMRTTSHCDHIAPEVIFTSKSPGLSHLCAQVTFFTTKSPLRQGRGQVRDRDHTRAKTSLRPLRRAVCRSSVEPADARSGPIFINSTNIVDGLHPDSIPPGAAGRIGRFPRREHGNDDGEVSLPSRDKFT
jgi:hypothetical protein